MFGISAKVEGDAVKDASIVLGVVDPKPVRISSFEAAANEVVKTLTLAWRAGDVSTLTATLGKAYTDHTSGSAEDSE